MSLMTTTRSSTGRENVMRTSWNELMVGATSWSSAPPSWARIRLPEQLLSCTIENVTSIPQASSGTRSMLRVRHRRGNGGTEHGVQLGRVVLVLDDDDELEDDVELELDEVDPG